METTASHPPSVTKTLEEFIEKKDLDGFLVACRQVPHGTTIGAALITKAMMAHFDEPVLEAMEAFWPNNNIDGDRRIFNCAINSRNWSEVVFLHRKGYRLEALPLHNQSEWRKLMAHAIGRGETPPVDLVCPDLFIREDGDNMLRCSISSLLDEMITGKQDGDTTCQRALILSLSSLDRIKKATTEALWLQLGVQNHLNRKGRRRLSRYQSEKGITALRTLLREGWMDIDGLEHKIFSSGNSYGVENSALALSVLANIRALGISQNTSRVVSQASRRRL
jgi:hypothetical protein